MSPDRKTIDLAEVATSAARQGLNLRGAFHPQPEDKVPDVVEARPAATLVLLGFVGRNGWPGFAKGPEARDGAPDPLDRWSRRLVSAMAQDLGALPLFPFGGPPWLPFGRWALRSGDVFSSPLGILIHPTWGLWHSYRGALAFAERLDLPARNHDGTSPCETCDAKPCLHACPVSAFLVEGYAVGTCRGHVASPAGAECRSSGCLSRRACPVGSEQRYGADQTAFLMRAFA